MKKFVDYYKLLGIKSDANLDEIRRAYHKQARLYHPDKSTMSGKDVQEEHNKRIKLINEAKEVLTDNKKRAKYDVEYKVYKRKERLTNAYQEDRQQPVEHDTEDFSKPWPKSSESSQKRQETTGSRQEREEKKEEETFTFTDIDEDYLYSIRQRRYNKDSKKKREVNLEKFFQNASSTIKNLVVNNQMFRSGKYSRGWTLGEKILVGTVAVGIVGTIVVTSLPDKNSDELPVLTASTEYDHEEQEETTTPTLPEEQTTAPTEKNDPYITLYRIHTVVEGDILSQYSKDSNTTIDELKRVNNTKSNNVVLGTDYIIPYMIEPEDLKYYSQVVEYDYSTSLEVFAKEYETNVDTLVLLNPEVFLPGIHDKILAETVIVPRFVTKEECNVLKEAEAITQKINKK